MKQLLLIFLSFSSFLVSARNVDTGKFRFGDNDGFASVLNQISGVSLSGNTIVYIGDSLCFAATVNSLPGVSYDIAWFRTGSGQLAVIGNQFTVKSVQPSDAGSYYCVVTDPMSGNTYNSDTLDLQVRTSQAELFSVMLSRKLLNGCGGGSDSLYIASYNINTDHCGADMKAKIAAKQYRIVYSWKKAGNEISQKSVLHWPVLAVSDGGKYSCEINIVANDGSFTIPAKMSDTCGVNITEAPNLLLNPTGDVNVVFGKAVTLMATGADTYLWSNGSRENFIAVTPMSKTTYTVTGYNANCSAKRSVTLDVMKLDLKITGQRVVFKGEEVTISVVTNADSVLWYAKPMTASASRMATSDGVLVGRGLTMTDRPAVSTIYNLNVYYKGVRSVMPFSVTVKDNFSGGTDDGYAQTCVPPSIVNQRGTETAGICKLSDAELMIQPEGSELKLEWQIFNRTTGEFEAFSGADNVTGIGKNKLKFTQFKETNNGSYRCVVSNQCGSVSSDTFHLNSTLAPVMYSKLNTDMSFCKQAEKAELGVLVYPKDKTITYQWYRADTPDGTFIPCSGAQNSYYVVDLFDTKADGVYKVVAQNSCGRDSSSVVLGVIPPAEIDSLSKTVNVCRGADARFFVTLKGKGSFKYILHQLNTSVPKSWVGPDVVIPGVRESGNYYWEIKSLDGCGDIESQVMSLKVDQPLTFETDVTLAQTDVCEGTRYELPVVLNSGDSQVNYLWEKNGVAQMNQNTSTLVLPSMSDEDEGRYQLRAKNKCPEVTSNQIFVKIRKVPVIIHSPELRPFYCNDDSVHMSMVTGSRFIVDSIRWFLNDIPLNDRFHSVKGAGTSHLFIPVLSETYAGVYVAKAYNSCGSSSTVPAKLELNKRTRIEIPLASYISPMCLPAKLGVKASGTKPLRYRWLYNGEPITDEFGRTAASSITDSLNLDDVPLWDKSGEYTCHVQNSCGDELTRATITFHRVDSFRLSGGGSYCQGGEGVTLTMAGSTPGVFYGLYDTSGYTGLTISGDDAVTPGGPLYFTRVRKGEYHVMAYSREGCSVRMPGEALVTEQAYPFKFKTGIIRHVCSVGGAGDIQIAGSEKYIHYYLCKRGTSGTWDTIPRIYPGTGDPITMEYIQSGVYKIVALNPLTKCSVSMDEVLELTPRLLPEAGNLTAVDMDSVACFGINAVSQVSLEYDRFEPGYKYTLKRNGMLTDKVREVSPVIWHAVEPGFYTVMVTNEYGCNFDVSHQYVIARQAPKVFTVRGEGGFYCQNKAYPRWVELDNSEKGIKYSLYAYRNSHNTYKVKDTLGTGQPMLFQVLPDEAEFYIVATDTMAEACESRMDSTVKIMRSRLSVTPTSGVIRVLPESSATLSVTVTDAVGGYQIRWRDPDNLLPPESYTQEHPKTKPIIDEPITYFYTVTDGMGCSKEGEITVEPHGCAFSAKTYNAAGDTSTYERICREDPVYFRAKATCLPAGGQWKMVVRLAWGCGNVRDHGSCHPFRAQLRYYPYVLTYRWYNERGDLLSTTRSRDGSGSGAVSYPADYDQTMRVHVSMETDPSYYHDYSYYYGWGNGWYDNNGNWHYWNSGGWYDEFGNWHKWGDGYFDGNGTWHSPDEVMSNWPNWQPGSYYFYNAYWYFQQKVDQNRLHYYQTLINNFGNRGLAANQYRNMNMEKWDALTSESYGTAVATERDYYTFVEVQDAPERYMIDETGLREIVLNSSSDIHMRMSDTRVTYTLQYSTDNINFEDIPDYTDVRGTGTGMTFTIPGNRMRWGFYRIMGTLVNQQLGDKGLTCVREMNGRVEIRKRKIGDQFEIERQMCSGDADADLRIVPTSKDATYFIYRQRGDEWVALPGYHKGTGEKIIIPKVPKGIYKAVVRIDFVDNDLEDIVEVKENSLPGLGKLEFMEGDSITCWGTPSTIGLKNIGTSSGLTYTLVKNGKETGEVRRTDPVVWMNLTKGVYDVKVTNQEGCSVTYGNRTVVEKDPPQIVHFSGQIAPYCKDGDPELRTLMIGTPQAGVKYTIGYLPVGDTSKIVLDSVSDGRGTISVKVPLIDRTYYVMATDTMWGCSREMENRLEIAKSKLAVRADRARVLTKCNTPAQMHITVSGATQPLKIEWGNAHLLGDGEQGKINPWTLPITESVRFNVTVTDSLNCPRTTSVQVECNDTGEDPPRPNPDPDPNPDPNPDPDPDPDPDPNPKPDLPDGDGGPLTAYIMDGDCNMAVDTITMCAGNELSLCANATGGLGKYYFRWSDDIGYIASNRGLGSWKVNQSGPIYLEVSMSGDNQVVRDTLWVNTEQAPLRFRVKNEGLRCVLPGEEVAFTLESSESSVEYRLQYSSDNFEFHETGETKEGIDGKSLSFTTVADGTNWGYYRITAKMKGGNINACDREMFGRVEMRQAPQIFNFSGGWKYCEGAPVVGTLALDSSQSAVTYALMTYANGKVGELQGTDRRLEFTDKYEYGRYYVIANIDQCKAEMNGYADVNYIKRPDIGVITSGIHCQEVVVGGNYLKDSLRITISSAVEGVGYYVTREIDGSSPRRVSDTLYGVNLAGIDFGKFVEKGKYSVVLVNKTAGCTYSVPGPEIRLSRPKDIVWDLSTCTENNSGSIVYVDLDSAMRYDVTSPYGTEILPDYKGNLVKTGLLFGKYCLQVTDPQTNCKTEQKCGYLSRMIRGSVDSVIWHCGDAFTDITIHNMDPEGMYAIYPAIEGMETMGLDTLVYPNNVFHLELDPPNIGDPQMYIFRKWRRNAEDGNACEKNFVFELTRRRPPIKYNVFPKENIIRLCPGDMADIRLEHMQNDAVYTLEYTANNRTEIVQTMCHGCPNIYRYDTIYYQAWRPCPNHGSSHMVSYTAVRYEPVYLDSLSMGPRSKEGWYELWADNGCRVLMKRFRIVTAQPPEQIAIYGADKCITDAGNDSIKVWLADRDTYISYFLYNGDKLMDSIPFDTDMSVKSFRPQMEVGCYHAIAKNSSPVCTRQMKGSVCLSTEPLIFSIEDYERQRMICREADSIPIWLANSQVGVRYRIVSWADTTVIQPGDEDGLGVEGIGDRILVGYAHKAGNYYVVAKVGGCQVYMKGVVSVQKAAAPVLNVDEVLRYCAGEPGALVKVKSPTSDTVQYSLYSPEGLLLENQTGFRDGAELSFLTPARDGYVRVIAQEHTFGCIDSARIEIIQDSVPELRQLQTTNNGYICKNGSTELYVTASQKGVEYTLYNKDNEQKLAVASGNGARLSLAEVADLGSYYVVASMNSNSNCRTNVSDTLTLVAAPEITPFKVNAIKRYYCQGLNASGLLELDNSQSGIAYELYQEGVPTGRMLQGGLGRLEWGQLKGELCGNIDPNDEENSGKRYTVWATELNSGCKQEMKGDARIIEEQPPKILISSPNLDVAVCDGEPLYMNVALASGCNLEYELIKDGVSIYRGDTAAYNIAAVNALRNDLGTYQWKAYNSCGVYNGKRPFVVKGRTGLVNARPLTNISMCDIKDNDIVLTAGFENALAIEWWKKGDTTVLQRGQTFVARMDKSQAGTYYCRAWNECNRRNPMIDSCVIGYGKPSIQVTPSVDTLCKGMDITYSISTMDEFHWLFENTDLNVTNRNLELTDVNADDEGLYYVRVINNCGDSTYKVGTLYVDDTISIVDVYPDTIRCKGDLAELYIKTNPSERVKYRWELNGQVLSHTNTCKIGPMEEANALNYRVWYWNACTYRQNKKYHDVNINIPAKISYTSVAESITFCADCVTDTVLRLNADPAMLAKFEWFYRRNADEAGRTLQNSYADTLKIKMCSSASGFYYCRIYNDCVSETVRTSWVKVDSVPALETPLQAKDTVCEGEDLVLMAKGTGGNLTYRLEMWFRDGRYIEERYFYSPYSSTCSYAVGAVTMDMDGCRVAWTLENSCGEYHSDTTTLVVMPSPSIAVNVLDSVACAGDSARIEVVLNGAMPWEYGYQFNGGERKIVANILTARDTLRPRLSGKYEFNYMKDYNGCHVKNFDEIVNISVPDPTIVDLIAQGDVCRGDSLKVNVKVNGPGAPWQLTIYRYPQGGTAEEAYEFGAMPLIVSKDTTIAFVNNNMGQIEYYVKTAVSTYGGKLTCPASSGSSAEFEVKRTDDVVLNILTEDQKHLSGCKPTDLFLLLNPRPQAASGKFVIVETGKEIARGMLDEAPGCYTVKYSHISDNGCPSFSMQGNVTLCVDSLPSVKVTPQQKNTCGGFLSYVYFDFRGKAPFTYTAEVQRFMGNTLDGTSALRDRIARKSRDSMALDSYDEITRYVYRVLSMKDAHGCNWFGPVSDTVFIRSKIAYDVFASYRGFYGGEWFNNCTPIYFPKGDSVRIAYTMTKGKAPWSVGGEEYYTGQNMNHQMTKQQDTAYFAKQGYWQLQGRDQYGCGADAETCLDLRMLDTGYITCKVLLDGPYDLPGKRMVSKIKNKLPLYGGKPLPDTEKEIIDWIFIELRVEPEAMPTSIDTCLVLSDGTVVDRNGNPEIGLMGGFTQSGREYHVVVRHRNHLSVMTNLIELGGERGNAKKLDLTKASSIYCSPKTTLDQHMSNVGGSGGTEVWAMSAGEVNENQVVTNFDPNSVAQKENTSGAALGYEDLIYDLNLNGKIEWPGYKSDGSLGSIDDWTKARKNRNKYTEVPDVRPPSKKVKN